MFPVPQESIQVRKFPPFALVTHPDPLLRIPSTGTMEKEEGIASGTTVLGIQLFDPLPGKPQQRFVLRQRFLLGVSKIGQQAEVQVIVPICQEPHFKRLDQILYILRAHEHRRNHDQRAEFRRDPFGEVHARQRMGCRQQRRQPIHQGNGKLTYAQN